jgi:hypothetical protein
MTLLSVTITHYRALKTGELAPPGLEYRRELTERRHLGLLSKFEPLCELSNVRQVNWAQSFARRGFSISDYIFEDAKSVKLGIEHQFKRAAGADLRLPQELRFTENRLGSALPGDVLFYREKISVLHASRLFSLQCGLTLKADDALHEELKPTGVHGLQVAARLGSLIKVRSARESYQREILEGWDEARSFLIL